MSDCYYVLITNKPDTGCPSYISIWKDQYNIQSNIFGASKFTKKETAEKAKIKASCIFKNLNFDIIEINKQIFGKEPRFVETEFDVHVMPNDWVDSIKIRFMSIS